MARRAAAACSGRIAQVSAFPEGRPSACAMLLNRPGEPGALMARPRFVYTIPAMSWRFGISLAQCMIGATLAVIRVVIRARLASGRPLASALACGVLIAALCAGCRSGTAGNPQLASNHPLDRAEAAVRAADRGDANSIHALVDLLEDPDDVVRMVAIHSLRRLCGEDFGYRYYADPAARAVAVVRWREALRSGTLRVAAEWPSTSPAAQSDAGAAPTTGDTLTR